MEPYDFHFNRLLKQSRAAILYVLLSTAAVSVCRPLYAAPAYNGYPGPKEHVNLPSVPSAEALKAQASGTKKIAVILVDFETSGLGSNTSGGTDSGKMTSADLANLDVWFGTAPASKTFPDFYKEASYSKLDIEVTFVVENGTFSDLANIVSTNCFSMPSTMAYYGADTQSSLGELLNDALQATNAAGMDISTATFDYFMVAHAGNGQESTYPYYLGDIWSVYVSMTAQKNGFTAGTIVPAREYGTLSPLGVLCHEFGHQIGLPDIYDTNSASLGSTRVGVYALMDSGTWNDNGATPPHPCSWSKIYLGWLASEELEGNVNDKSLPPYYNNSNDSVFKFIVPATSKKEYFLLSYRKNGGYDSASINSSAPIEWGPVILHIDDTVGVVSDNDVNNSKYDHPRIAIVGEDEFDRTSWNTSKVFTSPYSDSYSGSVSGITIYGFSISGGSMLFDAVVAVFASSLKFLERPQNYPNPVTKGITTLTFKLSKPDEDLTIRIYTPSGELVRKVEKEEITAYYAKDNEIVYKYEWDTGNSKGDEVASGVYIYSVEAGSESRIGRLTVIR